VRNKNIKNVLKNTC